MEGTPQDIDARYIKDDLLESVPGLEDVHHIHIWCLTQERPLLTLHARVGEDTDNDTVLRQINERLKARHMRGPEEASHN